MKPPDAAYVRPFQLCVELKEKLSRCPAQTNNCVKSAKIESRRKCEPCRYRAAAHRVRQLDASRACGYSGPN